LLSGEVVEKALGQGGEIMGRGFLVLLAVLGVATGAARAAPAPFPKPTGPAEQRDRIRWGNKFQEHNLQLLAVRQNGADRWTFSYVRMGGCGNCFISQLRNPPRVTIRAPNLHAAAGIVLAQHPIPRRVTIYFVSADALEAARAGAARLADTARLLPPGH
jgi:hypothetical protein